MDPTLAVMAIVICTRLAFLGALALRLRSGTRRHRQQLHAMTSLTPGLPPGTLLELDTSHEGSTRLRLQTSIEQDRREPHA